MRLLWKLFSYLLSFCYLACRSVHISFQMTFFASWRRVCFHFKRPCRRRACLHERSTLVTILVTETADLCSSAFTASCKLLANITCSVVEFIRRLVWSSIRLVSVSSLVTSATSSGNHRRRMKIRLSTVNFSTWKLCLCRCACTNRAVIQWLPWFSWCKLIITVITRYPSQLWGFGARIWEVCQARWSHRFATNE